ncbi:MAG: hypothetical protein IT454_01975 [Planctomycetes bacterium]|nr:hypothetical protein [Planctomycetota bacterium]
MKRTVFLLVVLAPFGAAQSIDPETWARTLIDSPHLVSDDPDARFSEGLRLVARDPGNALAEATLTWIDSIALDDPRAATTLLAELRGDTMMPIAASELARLQAEFVWWNPAGNALLAARPSELYPQFLRQGWVLGPLRDPFDAAARQALFAEPRFGEAHQGFEHLPLRWSELTRPATSRSFDVQDTLESSSGWALCAFVFEVPKGGPGWLELDLRDASGPHMTAIYSTRDGAPIPDAVLRVALNEDAPATYDFVTDERPVVQRQSVVWRAGVNRVLLSTTCNSNMDFALRVLDAGGAPVSGVRPAALESSLGEPVRAQLPATPPTTSLSYLTALRERGPNATAFLAWIQIRSACYAAGFESLERSLAADPQSIGIRALAAELYGRDSHLPETYRRGRARELIESVLASEPRHVRMQTALARILAPEDKEEEAIEALLALSKSNTRSVTPALELAGVYPRLEMQVATERQLREAVARAPRSPRTLNRLADLWSSVGERQRALAAYDRSLEQHLDPRVLQRAAALHAELGFGGRALELLELNTKLDTSHAARLTLAEEWIEQRKLDQAEGALATLSAERPRDTELILRRADVARMRGDAALERQLLDQASARRPSDPSLRSRRRALGLSDPARALFERFPVDIAAELATFDAKKWSDHVVRAIDSATVYVFEDGALEQWTVERDVALDLAGCESLGKQAPRGEMQRIATIKADGSEYEPVLVDGEYVMPALQPGDSVEAIAIAFDGAPFDGRARVPKWFFASVEKPFALSRYVISLPKALGLELAVHNFSGRHDVLDEGARVVHVFEQRDSARVVPEPSSPPTEWYLPWIEFGESWPTASSAEILTREITPRTHVTPTIRAAAERVVAGIASEEAKARALHAFVAANLDQRAPNGRASATSALLTREGNGTLLYAALLDAAGIDHEVFWSRAVDPAADGEPAPRFPGPGRWARAMAIQVRPNDGPVAWCDMGFKTLPYGKLLSYAPNAEAYGTQSRQWIAMPSVAPAERLGYRMSLKLALAADRSAQVEFEMAYSGNLGFVEKEQLREVPATQLRRVVTQRVARNLPGLDIVDFDLRNLQSDTDELVWTARGRHKSLLDEAGGEISCKLPFPRLELGRAAGGAGERKQPFVIENAIALSTRVRVELPDGLSLAEALPETRLEFGDGRYRLTLEDASPAGFTLVRELTLPPRAIAPEQFPEYLAFTRAVDEAERVPLRFARRP